MKIQMKSSLALTDITYAAGQILTVGDEIPAVRADEYVSVGLAAVIEADAPPGKKK